MQSIVTFFIYTHAILGGIALLSGMCILFLPKGNSLHKKVGNAFYYSLLFSICLSFVIGCFPNHQNMFLVLIGFFSLYSLYIGKRSLKYRNKNHSFFIDTILAYSIIGIGIIMILYPILVYSVINIVMLVFGIISIIFGIRDLYMFKNIHKNPMAWLKQHLGNMLGAFIASLTAFCVVNDFFSSIWNWFIPTIIITPYMIFWMIKVNTSPKTSPS